MKCPACARDLTEVQLGPLAVDVCAGGCGGVWFDAFELQRVDEVHETEGNPLFHIERDAGVVVDPARKRECPRCAGIKLTKRFFSRLRRVQVDHCPNCAGYWLDYGELAAIQAETHSRIEKQPRPAAGSVSSEFIRYLYKLQSEKSDAS